MTGLFSGSRSDGVAGIRFSCRRDRLTIRGVHMRPAGENLPIAVVSHGFMANGKSVARYAWALARMGYAAFCFDFCGGSVMMNRSGGKTTDMSVLTEAQDLKAVIQYAQSLPYTDEKRVVLMGCSQGGFVSALVAAELKEQISSLVLFYPALCIPDDARAGQMMFARFDPQNIPPRIRCGPMKLGRRYVTDVIGMSPYDEITPYPGDVLIVHGAKDMLVKLEYAKRALEAYSGRACGSVLLKVIADGGHGFSAKEDEAAVQYVRQFLMGKRT